MIMSVMFGSGLIYLPKIKRHGLSQRILSEAAVTKMSNKPARLYDEFDEACGSHRCVKT